MPVLLWNAVCYLLERLFSIIPLISRLLSNFLSALEAYLCLLSVLLTEEYYIKYDLTKEI